MEYSRLLVTVVVLGFISSCLGWSMERKSSFNELESIAPLASDPNDVILQRTKRQWGGYGVGEGMRGMLWGLVLSGLLHPPAPSPK